MKARDNHHPHPGDAPKRPAEEAAAPQQQPQGADVPDYAELLAAKTEECKELVDQLQRLAAEYSNYQKRMERHFQEEKKHGIRALVLDLLPAIDNFERALDAAASKPSFESLLEGVKAVHDQMLAALAKHGVEQIDAAGQPFDPEHHEAVTLVPSESQPDGQVVEVMQKGYRLHGRTIRPSRVAVSGGPPKPEPSEPGNDNV
jgi:molecular chaperone GrpE